MRTPRREPFRDVQSTRSMGTSTLSRPGMDSRGRNGYTWALGRIEVTAKSVAEGWPSPVEGVRLEIG